jgi:HSP20 family protein
MNVNVTRRRRLILQTGQGWVTNQPARLRDCFSNCPQENVMANIRVFEPALDSFESMFRRFMAPMRFETEPRTLEMRVDVTEKDAAYVVRADLPGVKKDDINVRIDGNIVQIDAEVKEEKDTKGNGDKVLRSERYYGSVSRAFTLAQDVDEAKSTAKYDNGVLTLTLPKKSTATAKKLAIQ